jgi:soluble lytic murein transglycosylase-like protein
MLSGDPVSKSMLRRLLLAAVFCAVTPVVASAQIYTWRDAAGNLVMSNKPKDGSARSYAVAATNGTIRTTRPLVTSRAARFADLIEEHAERQSLSPALVRAVIQAESGFNPRARSVKGAMGLMQLMPETAAEYGVENAYDPEENIRAGTEYLASLIRRYDDNEELALAAYNAGPGAVEKYGRTIPPYRETRSYVARILSRAAASPARTAAAVFKTVEVVDGHEVVRYSSKRSADAEPLHRLKIQ